LSLTVPISYTATEIHPLSLHDALPISLRRLGLRDAARELGGEPAAPPRPARPRRLVLRLALPGPALSAAGLEEQLAVRAPGDGRSEEHTSELQSRENLVCRLLLEKKNI